MGPCADPPLSGLLEGIRQFNRGEFYECHETLERLWVAERGEIRRFYQGILQVGVAFYHLGRRNFRGATSLMESGLAYLKPFAPVCMTVNVLKLREETIGCYRELTRLGKERMAEFDAGRIPKIELVDPPAPLSDG